MYQEDVNGMANRVNTDQTVPQEQSDQILHCLLRSIGPNI